MAYQQEGVAYQQESPTGLKHRPRVWCRVGEKFVGVIILNWVPHGGSGVMVWAGISYRQQILLHFIYVNLNAQRYRDKILRPIVVPFIRCHHLMFQHDNALPHVTRVCKQFLEVEHFHGLHTHQICHSLSMFGMLWIDMYNSVFQFPPILHNFAQPLKRSRTTFHSPQSTAWSTICKEDAWGKWWSHQILTGFLIHGSTLF